MENTFNRIQKLDALFVLLLVSPFWKLFAQNTSGEINIHQEKKCRISFSISPIIANRILSSNSDTIELSSISVPKYIDESNRICKNNIGYKFGMEINYNIKDKLQVYTGLGFLSFEFEYVMAWAEPAKFSTPENPNPGITYDYVISAVNHKYLTIPLGINCELFSTGQISLGVNGEISVGYLLNPQDRNILLYSSPKEYYTYSIVSSSHFTFIGAVGLNIEYKYNKQLSLFCRPNFSISIVPNHKLFSKIDQRDYHWASDLGIIWQFD